MGEGWDVETTQEQKKELFGDVHGGMNGGPDLTDAQQQGLLQIEQNQQEVNQILEMISSGIDDLKGRAQGMNDVVEVLSFHLD